MLVMTLLLASIATVKLEDSEDDIEDVRKGREIMEKVKANNLSFQFDLVINRYVGKLGSIESLDSLHSGVVRHTYI